MRIVVTGGIGSGKSTLVKRLAHAFPALSVFSIDHEVEKLYENQSFLAELARTFGATDKKHLSNIVFADHNKRKLLESLSESHLAQRVSEIFRHSNAIIEFPLYFEKFMPHWTPEAVISVSCREELRAQRVYGRDGTRSEKFQQILGAQLTDTARETLADLVIRTDGTPEVFEADFSSLVNRLRLRLLQSKACATFGSEGWADLERQYSTAPRAYHTLEHLSEMFTVLDSIPHVPHKAAIELACWFHDYVYDPKAPKGANELASVAAMKRFILRHRYHQNLEPGYPLALAAELIVATVSHAITSPFLKSTPGHLHAAQLFLDADLAILGSSPERFAAYEAQIRQEYQHVPEQLYCQGRLNVLELFSKRERIFLSAEMAHLEANAGANLQQAIERLKN